MAKFGNLLSSSDVVTSEELVQKLKENYASEFNSFKNNLDKIIYEAVDSYSEKAIEKRRAFFIKGKWLGDDIGSPQEPLRDLHMRGQVFGLRLENCSELPESSGQSVGRIFYHKEKVYLNCGWGLKQVSSDKVSKNIVWPEGAMKVEVDLSDECIDDAQEAIWQLSNPENGHERVRCKISTPEKKKLIIEVSESLAAQTYKLLGIE